MRLCNAGGYHSKHEEQTIKTTKTSGKAENRKRKNKELRKERVRVMPPATGNPYRVKAEEEEEEVRKTNTIAQ